MFIFIEITFRIACGIEFEDQIIVTGGQYTNKIVSVYNDDGWVKDLPTLKIGRFYHTCGHYSSDNDLVKGTYYNRFKIILMFKMCIDTYFARMDG